MARTSAVKTRRKRATRKGSNSHPAAVAKRPAAARSRATKYVYFFGGGKAEGRGDQKDLLGGKGAGLAEMTNIGLPVPAGFTITTEACAEYYKLNGKFPKELAEQVDSNL